MNLIFHRLFKYLLCIIPTLGFAQQHTAFSCGFEVFQNPQLESFEQQIRQFLTSKDNAAEKGFNAPPYVIPVVVHIIHNNGGENLPDSRIIAAINHLNEGFAAGGYFGEQGAVVNTQIQFCLAGKDPDGLSTTGITRNQSPLTDLVLENDDIILKDLNRWNPEDYLNIWVVNEINSLSFGAGIAGYAFFPTAHGLPQDGIVCEAKYFGASSAEDALLIHEAGHYLGLYHTFEGGCYNNDCNMDGDRVCDTPPDMAIHTACPFNSCSTDIAPGSPFAVDADDLTANFLDYSPFPCYQSFTADQTDRMHGALETARKSLLQSTGCQGPCSQVFMASFTPSATTVMVGEPVTFTNTSINATQFTWIENGAIFSQQEHPTYVFNTVGVHHVVLDIGNSDPNCMATTGILVQVTCNIQPAFTPDQMVAPEGTAIHFTNQSIGGGQLTYEWTVNGQLVSNDLHLDHIFNSPGYYTVTLFVYNQFCQQETSVQITITSPCGLSPEPGQVAYTGIQKLFQPRDLIALSDGSIIQVGEHFQRPMLTKWDVNGDLVWNKEAQADGTYTQIEASPDGHFIITGEFNEFLFLAKIDSDGNVLWSKKFNDTPDFHYLSHRQFEVLAVNLDGTFGFLHRDDAPAISVDLSKFNGDGSLIWSRKLHNCYLAGSLRLTEDGAGDFIFTGHDLGNQSSNGIHVIIITQNGDLKIARKYRAPSFPIQWMHNIGLGVHSDGGYTLFYTEAVSSTSNSVRKYLARFNSDGSEKWGLKFTLPNGDIYKRCFIRQLANEKGFVMIDSRTDASFNSSVDIMIRIDNDGNTLWARDYGDTPANDFWVTPPIYHDGYLRSVHCDFFNFDIQVMHIYDSERPMVCAPIIENQEQITQIDFISPLSDVYSANQDISIEDFTMTLTPVSLQKKEVCSSALPCPEICNNEFDDDLDGLTDCFDQDCPCFSTDTACVAKPLPIVSAKLTWESSVDQVAVTAVPLVANLNPVQDSLPEVIVLEGSQDINSDPVSHKCLIFRGNGSMPAELMIPEGVLCNPQSLPVIADFDRNGIPELAIVTKDGLIRIYTDFDPAANPCMKLWAVSNQPVSSTVTHVYTADFNGDGLGELYAGSDVFQLNLSTPGNPSLIRVLHGAGAQANFGHGAINVPQSSSAADLLSIPDCNGDPDCKGLEIAAGFHIYSVDLDLNDGDGLEIKIQRDLNLMDGSATHDDGYTTIADLNLDGVPEILVSGARNSAPGIYAWNKDGLLHVFTDPSYGKMHGMICVANVLDDREAGFFDDFPELLVCQPNGMVCTNLQKAQNNPAQPNWWTLSTQDPSGTTGISAFDFNGDGLMEPTYRDQDFLRIIYGGLAPFPAGVDNERNWFKTATGSITLDEYPVVADVDADGEADLLTTGFQTSVGGTNPPTDTRGRLRVFSSPNNPWRPARPIWNQYHYFGLNILDNLSVSKNQQKHWLEMNTLGNTPFNTHLAQTGTLDPSIPGKISSPDLVLTIDSLLCHTDSLILYCTICNIGTANLNGVIPFSFYDNDPTLTAANLLTGPLHVTTSLETGTCANLAIKIPAIYNTSIFVVCNDNGSLPTPFNIATDFPSTNWQECHFENNMGSFSMPYQTPVLDLGPDLSLCKNSVVNLHANPSFQRYKWQDGTNSPSYTAYQAGKYWVDAYDACGYIQTDTVLIVLNQTDTLGLPNSLALCEGDSIVLEVSGFTKYTWSPSELISCSTCPKISLAPTQSLPVFVTATEGDCFVTDSVQILVHPAPNIQMIVENGNCGAAGTITAHISGSFPFHHLWSNGSTETYISSSISAHYTVQVVDQYGCESTATDSVFIQPAPGLIPVVHAPKCAGQNSGFIDLTVIGGIAPFGFLWSNNMTTEDLNQIGAGQYEVILTDANQCSVSSTFVISDPPALMLDIVDSGLVCPGDTAVIWANVSGGIGPYTFQWSAGDTSSQLLTIQAGLYQVTATDANDCNIIGWLNLTVPSPIQIAIQTDSVQCFGEATGSIQVLAIGGTPPLMYRLDTQNFDSSSQFDQLPAGTYQVCVEDAKGCQDSLQVKIFQPAVLQVTLNGDTQLLPGDTMVLSAQVLPVSAIIDEIQWTANGSVVEADTWDLKLPVFESTTFQIEITDEHGCLASNNWFVEIDDLHKVFAPNIMAPEIPGGNQFFTIFTGADALEIAELTVFDRWGSQVFQGRHIIPNIPEEGWDGTHRGQWVQTGVYVWVAKIRFRDGSSQTYRGDLTIMR